MKPISMSTEYIDTQNCRIWETENSFGHQPVPLHSEEVTVWCGFTASFIVGLFFFKEIVPAGPVTYTVNGVRYESLLCNHVIPVLQQRACVGNRIFMEDSALPYIENSV
ncbi:hypothetical protein AVEN_226402-1 [Araneus ventricosus]|uniref:Uncharacterized protein n=1 Tax=Araneus ventricosus TaxID=182803 RepID=A0A4Y2H041_ARAVE|nr:hypothetical protein AVEN_226402-1 [Araneus ventricosus]